MNSNESENPKTLHLFITGGARVGKSHLIQTRKMVLEKKITDYVGPAKKLKVIL